MWTCLNEKPGRKSPVPAARGDSSRTRAMPYTSRKRRFTPSQRRLPAAWLEPLSSRYQSKYELARGGGETRGLSKRHGLGHTFVKWSSLAAAKTLHLPGR